MLDLFKFWKANTEWNHECCGHAGKLSFIPVQCCQYPKTWFLQLSAHFVVPGHILEKHWGLSMHGIVFGIPVFQTIQWKTVNVFISCTSVHDWSWSCRRWWNSCRLVSNLTSPQLLGQRSDPSSRSHNRWVSPGIALPLLCAITYILDVVDDRQ